MQTIIKHSTLTVLLAFVFALAGFSSVIGQTITNVKFKRGATNRPYSSSVSGKGRKLYRVQLLRGSVLFASAKGKIKFNVRSGGRVFPIAAGENFASSNYKNLQNTKFTIEVLSVSGRREKYTLYISATVLK